MGNYGWYLTERAASAFPRRKWHNRWFWLGISMVVAGFLGVAAGFLVSLGNAPSFLVSWPSFGPMAPSSGNAPSNAELHADTIMMGAMAGMAALAASGTDFVTTLTSASLTVLGAVTAIIGCITTLVSATTALLRALRSLRLEANHSSQRTETENQVR